MKEDFLHYVWKYQKFNVQKLTTTCGANLIIVKVGEHNLNSGPDFFNAQVSIGNQLWAGNVEIHKQSSDWYAHHHEKDINYDNVILHVVWEYNADIFRKDNSTIPTLELKQLVEESIIKNYHRLFSKKQQWINCENDFPNMDTFLLDNWLDRLYLERLQQKSNWFEKELKSTNNHWENLLFKLLCKNFGLKVNGESFLSIAQSIDFSIVKKCNSKKLELEALLFGQAGFFESSYKDPYFGLLKEKYLYLNQKFNINNKTVIHPKYFRLRPTNFPTIRLSQFAVLLSKKQSLFSRIMEVNSLEGYYAIFNISANEYWDTHYNFGVSSTKKKKSLTKKFIDLLLINTIIPLKFSYANFLGKDVSEEIMNLASSIPIEVNSIIQKFNQLRPTAKSSLQSQGLLQLKNEYCIKNKCLQCAVGNSILKES